MKWLLLLRHASAHPAEPGGDDHDRPLSPGGLDEAARVGVHLAKGSAAPSLILCSSARRAVQTANRVAEALAVRPRLQVERAVYMAGPAALLEQLMALSDAEPAVLVVAHNPGVQALALRLARDGCERARSRLTSRFPAGSLAVFALPVQHWAEAGRGGRLDAFTRPGDLMC